MGTLITNATSLEALYTRPRGSSWEVRRVPLTTEIRQDVSIAVLPFEPSALVSASERGARPLVGITYDFGLNVAPSLFLLPQGGMSAVSFSSPPPLAQTLKVTALSADSYALAFRVDTSSELHLRRLQGNGNASDSVSKLKIPSLAADREAFAISTGEGPPTLVYATSTTKGAYDIWVHPLDVVTGLPVGRSVRVVASRMLVGRLSIVSLAGRWLLAWTEAVAGTGPQTHMLAIESSLKTGAEQVIEAAQGFPSNLSALGNLAAFAYLERAAEGAKLVLELRLFTGRLFSRTALSDNVPLDVTITTVASTKGRVAVLWTEPSGSVRVSVANCVDD